jgi:hypothetical protein
MLPRVKDRRRRWIVGSVAAGVVVVAGAVLAQGPVLHEFVPDPSDDEALVLASSSGPEPAAIVYDGEVIPAPRDGALRPDERAMSGWPGEGQDAGRRSPTFRPDRVTELEGTLGYFTVFTPSIAPFKRVTALDTVTLEPDGTPVLAVGDQSTREIPVVGATAAAPDERERDRFWGSVVLDFGAGRVVPLPSVSPESRILTMRTEPEVALRISTDDADNFFAEAVGHLPSAQVRLTFLTDAPGVYFNAATIPAVAADALADEATELPPSVRASAETFLGELGIDRGMDLEVVLAALTEHFRAFEESDEFPADTGDIFLDLARAGKGVCRHRAYAFQIAALALGIPTRFVMNEAHAWVEVKMPSVGWMRIDLGGAAQGLEAHGEERRLRYRPENPDPLPRPEAYERSYSRPQAEPPPSAAAAGGSGGAASSSASSSGASSRPVDSGGGGAPLAISVDRSRWEVFRGRMIEVSGRVVDTSGAGVDALRLEVLLSGEREMLLGVTVSDPDGYYRGSFGIPPDLDVGEYRLAVRTPGNADHPPAQVE